MTHCRDEVITGVLVLLASAALVAVLAFGEEPLVVRPEAKFGFPTSDIVLRHGFVQARPTHITMWTLEYLTPNRKFGDLQRTGEDWRTDHGQPAEFRWSPHDYLNSGYDKGHEANAEDQSWSQAAMDDSFVITNTMPQDPKLNRGQWGQLERFIRSEVTTKRQEAWVLTGPAFVPDEHGAIRIHTLGPLGRIWVPTHCWKSVIFRSAADDHGGTKIEICSWLMPNRDDVKHFDEYRVTTDALEATLGLDLWPGLDREQEKLEAQIYRQ